MRTIFQASLAAINLYSEYFLGLLVSIIIARNLSTEEYGIYSSAIWLAGLVTIAINAGLSITVTKFVAEFKKNNQQQLSNLLAFIRKVLVKRIIFVVAVFLLLIFFDVSAVTVPVWLILALLVCAVFKATYIYQISIFKGLQRFDVLAKTSMIANPINLLSVALFAYFSPSIEGFLVAYCIACLAFALSILSFKKQMPQGCTDALLIDEDKQRVIGQIYAASVIIFFGALIFRQSQILVLEGSGLFSEAGYFNIAYILATSAVTLIPGIYQEVLLPKITQAVGNNGLRSNVLQAQRYLTILCLLVLVPVLMYADVVIDILYGERYQEAVFALQVLIILRVVVVINDGANLTLISHDRQRIMAKVNFFLFLIAAVLSYLITPQYGVEGALVVYGILIFLLVIFYNRIAKGDGYCLMPTKVFFSIIGAAALASMPSMLLNQYISGLLSAAIGSALFVLIYANLLFVVKGYDHSVTFLLEKFAPKMPKLVENYMSWAINRLK